jgi:hypothetical protein
VLNIADALAGEANCVDVSILRATKVYCVAGAKSLNTFDICQFAPLFLLNSQSAMAVSVMLFAVADANVGAAGAVCVCLVIGPTAGEVILPVQLFAVTTTDILAFTSVAPVM